MRRREAVRLAQEQAAQEARSRRDLACFLAGIVFTLCAIAFGAYAVQANDEQDWQICQTEARFHGIAIARYCPSLARKFWRDVD